MKYKACIEDDYTVRNMFEPDWYEFECDPIFLNDSLVRYCANLYREGGSYWMDNSNERIVVVDETGKEIMFEFSICYEPTFWVSRVK